MVSSAEVSHVSEVVVSSQADSIQLPWVDVAEQRLSDPSLPQLRTRRSISAFFPAYNDEGAIGQMVDYVVRTLRAVTDDFEIIVVNDGSRDNTAQVLAERQRRYPQLRVITHEKNKGYGGALKSGFYNATKELVFYTDGDGQYDPTEMLCLLPHIEQCDIVQGYKLGRADGLHRLVAGKLYGNFARFLFRLKIRDVDCDFRLMRREIFDRVKLESDFGFICTEMMKKIQDAGYQFHEVGVHHYPRVCGQSQFFTLRRIAETLRTMFAFRVQLWVEAVQRTRRAPRPQFQSSDPYEGTSS
jgi:glycosyltransferase involved in cell wall biosynthesis